MKRVRRLSATDPWMTCSENDDQSKKAEVVRLWGFWFQLTEE